MRETWAPFRAAPKRWGACGLVIPNKRSARVEASTYKSSAGAIAHLPVAQVSNLVQTIERFKKEGFWVAAATEHADQEVWDVNLKGKIALVVGNEGEGVSRLVLEHCDLFMRLPMEARWNPSMWRRPPRPACTSGSVRTARLRAEEGEGPAVGRQRKKLLIVDGYNVLRSGIRYRRIEDPDYTDDAFNVARERLINDVVNYAGNDWRAIIVFDGGPQRVFHGGRRKPWAAVRIMFSPAGQSADKVIEKLAHDARERQVETLVVTSDATIQDTVFGNGCDRMSADGFSREVGIVLRGCPLGRGAEDGAEEHPRRAGEPRGAGQAKGPPRR